MILSPIRYNSWVKVKMGFYSGFAGQVIDYGFFKYRVRLLGKELNNTLTDRLSRGVNMWWFNLELTNKPAELVKEDFYKEITKRDTDYDNCTTTSVFSSSISNATSVIPTSLSIEDEEQTEKDKYWI